MMEEQEIGVGGFAEVQGCLRVLVTELRSRGFPAVRMFSIHENRTQGLVRARDAQEVARVQEAEKLRDR